MRASKRRRKEEALRKEEAAGAGAAETGSGFDLGDGVIVLDQHGGSAEDVPEPTFCNTCGLLEAGCTCQPETAPVPSPVAASEVNRRVSMGISIT